MSPQYDCNMNLLKAKLINRDPYFQYYYNIITTLLLLTETHIYNIVIPDFYEVCTNK